MPPLPSDAANRLRSKAIQDEFRNAMHQAGFDVDMAMLSDRLNAEHRPDTEQQATHLRKLAMISETAPMAIQVLSHAHQGRQLDWADAKTVRQVVDTSAMLESLRMHCAGDEAGVNAARYTVAKGFLDQEPALARAKLHDLEQMGLELRTTADLSDVALDGQKVDFETQIAQAKRLMKEVARSAIYLDEVPGVMGGGERQRIGQALATIQNHYVDRIVSELPGITAETISDRFDQIEKLAYMNKPAAAEEVSSQRPEALNRLDGGADWRFFDPPALMTRHLKREIAREPDRDSHAPGM